MEDASKQQALPSQAPVTSKWLFEPKEYNLFDSPEPIYIQPGTPMSEMSDDDRESYFDSTSYMDPPGFERLDDLPDISRVRTKLPPPLPSFPSYYDEQGCSFPASDSIVPPPAPPTVPATNPWSYAEPLPYSSDSLRSTSYYNRSYTPQPPAAPSSSRWISHYPLPSSGSQLGNYPSPVDYSSGPLPSFKEDGLASIPTKSYTPIPYPTNPYTISSSNPHTSSWASYRSETPNPYAAYPSYRSSTPLNTYTYTYPSYRSSTPSNTYSYPSYCSGISNPYTHPSYPSSLSWELPPASRAPIPAPYSPALDPYDAPVFDYTDSFAQQNVPSSTTPLYLSFCGNNNFDYNYNKKGTSSVPPYYGGYDTPPASTPAPFKYSDSYYSPTISPYDTGVNIPAETTVTNLSSRDRLIKETKKRWLKDLFRTTFGYGVFSLGLTAFWLGLLYLYDSDLQYKKIVEEREALFAGCNYTGVSTADDSQFSVSFSSQGCDNISASLIDSVPPTFHGADARPYIKLFSIVAGYTIIILSVSTLRTARRVVRCVKQGNAFIDWYLPLRLGRKAEAARKKEEKASRLAYANQMYPKQTNCGCSTCGTGKTYLANLSECRCRYCCAWCYQSLSDALDSWDKPVESPGSTAKFYETVKPGSILEWAQKVLAIVFALHLPIILLVAVYWPILDQGPTPGEYVIFALNFLLALFFLRSVAKFTRQLIEPGEKNEFVEGTGTGMDETKVAVPWVCANLWSSVVGDDLEDMTKAWKEKAMDDRLMQKVEQYAKANKGSEQKRTASGVEKKAVLSNDGVWEMV